MENLERAIEYLGSVKTYLRWVVEIFLDMDEIEKAEQVTDLIKAVNNLISKTK